MGHIPENEAAMLMKQAFRAEFYMNEQGICHRDWKPENLVFLDREPILKSTLKLIDFGLACKCSKDQVLTTKAGTPYYVAPQVLSGKYDMAADMWSLGVILYVVLCGYPPFYGDTDAEILAKVRLGNFSFAESDWKNVTDDAKDVVRGCLKMEPKERLTPEQALKHQWFSAMEGHVSSESVAGIDKQFVDRFKQFRSATKFQKLVRQAIATRATDSQIKMLKESFLALDTDGNGTLTLDELRQAIEKAGFGDMSSDLTDIMDSIGSEGLNRIDYTEFLAAALDQKVFLAEDALWTAFHMFDKNGDGKLDVEEIKKVLGEGGNELSKEASTAAESMIAECDRNGDSIIDFAEFVATMKADTFYSKCCDDEFVAAMYDESSASQ
jgi:calcium-dependent protein kinase